MYIFKKLALNDNRNKQQTIEDLKMDIQVFNFIVLLTNTRRPQDGSRKLSLLK